jgi:hypothetical protein
MQSTPSNFWEWTAALESGQRTGMIALSIAAIVFVISILLITIYGMHKNRLQDSLKRELLDRGMSASEIAMVVRAKPGKHRCGDTPS